MTSGTASQHRLLGADTSLPVLDPRQNPFHHDSDIFTIVCWNNTFQLSLALEDVDALLLVCKQAERLASSRILRVRRWFMRNGLTFMSQSIFGHNICADVYAVVRHYSDQAADDLSWLNAQADQGNASASYLLARLFIETIDPMSPPGWGNKVERAIFRRLVQATDAGHIMAQFHLAKCYQGNHGVGRDDTKAIAIYRKLAAAGLVQAQVALGSCYEQGEGRAVQILQGLANDGHSDSQNLLGRCYSSGTGVAASQQQAFEWFLRSAALGNSYAEHQVGLCYLWGNWADRDHVEAFQWFRKSAWQGNRYGQYRFGICYWYGQGVARDQDEATNWFLESAVQGHEEARKRIN
ncbi:uncharacterized protein BJ171DRAFT_441962 [Polychytrium aggregatum]|uniref:uncharacterized protein n=1 Tax=Polychytrium aggregatum TaxID=110093 RepID=UPI0022FDBFE5|nr:uncharacterized protein BJ171DRAFT_441962 [Polychytrium aggregatum]KAI9205218.1 hypothetical protein BJ171DRAFT_441962 [Polychytrium aggregatum]